MSESKMRSSNRMLSLYRNRSRFFYICCKQYNFAKCSNFYITNNGDVSLMFVIEFEDCNIFVTRYVATDVTNKCINCQ